MRVNHHLFKTAFGVFAGVLSACAATSPPSTFYELRPVQPAQVPRVERAQVAIGVGPLELAEILDRPQLVMGGPDSEVRISEYHRWAGSLRDNLARVIATNLSWRTGNDQVVALPSVLNVDVDYRVALNVHRFGGGPTGEARLDVDWILLDRDARPLTPIRKVELKAVPTAEGYSGLVNALNDLVARLTDLLAEQLGTLQTDPATDSDTP